MSVAPSPSKDAPSKGSKQRIDITFTIPELNQSFMVNQPSDGCSALLITCIRWRLKNLLGKDRQLLSISFNGEEVDGIRSYPDLGITDGSVVVVTLTNGKEAHPMNTELSDGVDYGIERLLVLFRNEGVKSCLDAFCKKYVANDYSLNVLTALRDNIRIDSSTEKDLVEGLSAMLSLFLERKVKQQLILTIIQWYSKILQSCCRPPPSSSLASSAAPAILPAATQCLDAFPSEPLLTDPALQLLKALLSAPMTAELQAALQAADVAATLLRVMTHNPADSALAAQSFGLLAQWCAVCSRAGEAMDDPAFAETLAAYLEAAHLAPAAVPTLLQILNAVLTSEARVGQFCTSRLLQQVIALFALHDVAAMIQLFRFFLPFFRYPAMHHALLLCDILTTMEAAVNQYPRHSELASVIQSFLVEMVSEEAECIYVIHKGVFNIITTTFLALSYDVAIIISSIRTLHRLCSLSAFAVSLFVRSPLLLDSVYTTRNHPFNEPLWSAVLDLLLTVQTTAAGRAALQAKKIQMEIRSCLCLLKDTASVVAKASSLLDSLEPPEAHPEAHPEVALETASETASEAQPLHRLQPVSPLRPRTASVSHIELNQRPLQQQLSTRAAPGTDFLSLLLFVLADDGAHAFAYRAVECLFDLLDEESVAYLMQRIDLSAIIPCLSLTMLQYIRNDGLIEKCILILRYFTAYPSIIEAFFSEETITVLIEIITSYSHSISIVSNTFDILLFLSSQSVLRGPLKKAGVMRMIDSIYSAYDNDEAMSTTDYVRLSELLKAESSTSEPASSLRIELMKKARQLESNLGLRSENTESEGESSEKRMMEVVLHHFAHAERNEQLQILDALLKLVGSDCDHKLVRCVIRCNGVRTVIKVALRRVADKEIIVRSMVLLGRVLDVRSYRRANDLAAITAVTVSVLREQAEMSSVVVPTLMVLERYTAAEAAHYLADSCAVLHAVMKKNMTTGDVCDHLCNLIKLVCGESRAFRVQCIQCGLLESVLEAVKYHSNHASFLFNVCDILILLAEEPALDAIACRFDVVSLLLHFLSSSFMSDPSFIALSLQALHAVVCLSASMAEHFAKKQGLTYLCHVLEDNNTSLEVVTAGAEFLASLASQYDIARDVIATGLIPALLRVLAVNRARSPTDLLACFQTLRALACLSIDCVKTLLAAQAVPALVATLRSLAAPAVVNQTVNQNVNQTVNQNVNQSVGAVSQTASQTAEDQVTTECVWVLYQCSTTQEGCEELQRCGVEAALQGLSPAIAPDHDIAIKRDLLLQNLAIARRQHAVSPRSVQPPVASGLNDLSHLVDSPLLQIMHTLVKCGEHAPMDVLISLKQLKTLCDSSVAVGDLVQYGCDVTMMEILQTFPADAEIARLAFLILGYFAEKAPEHVTLSQELLDLLLACLDAPAVVGSLACFDALVRFVALVTVTDAQLPALAASPLLARLLCAYMALTKHAPPSADSASSASPASSVSPVEASTESSDVSPASPASPVEPSPQPAQPAQTSQEAELFGLLTSFTFAVASRCSGLHCDCVREFFVANSALVSGSLLWLLKADIACRAVTRRSLSAASRLERPLVVCAPAGPVPDAVAIPRPFVDVCFEAFAQLSEESADVLRACDLIALLGHVEEYKEAFIDRGGIELLTRLFQAHRRELTFVPFLAAFLAVLPKKEAQLAHLSIDEVVQLFLEDDPTPVKSSDMVLGVLTMLCELFNAHAVVQRESTVVAILRNVELLNEDEHSVETAISALTSCLRCTASDALRQQVVRVLFDEVSKGARYSATQSDLAALYEEYQNDEAMLERFNRFAPTAVVRAFTQSVSTEVGLPNTTQLLCSYLRDESSVRLLLESGLLDAISSRITNTMSGAVRLSLLRVVYQICSFEVSCNELLQDKDLVASIRGMTLQTDCDNEELKLLSQSVFECLEKGFKNQNIKLEYVNPFSLDFGPVPSYSVLVWTVC